MVVFEAKEESQDEGTIDKTDDAGWLLDKAVPRNNRLEMLHDGEDLQTGTIRFGS